MIYKVVNGQKLKMSAEEERAFRADQKKLAIEEEKYQLEQEGLSKLRKSAKNKISRVCLLVKGEMDALFGEI